MSNCLVIGYGNTLRSDDGAGQRVAEAIAPSPTVRSLAVHQLTPELAEAIALTDLVIFVDAVVAPPRPFAEGEVIQVEVIEPAVNLSFAGHVTDPRSLLSLAQLLYGKAPPTYWILIRVVNLDFGEELSLITQQGVTEALEKIKEITETVHSDCVWEPGTVPDETDFTTSEVDNGNRFTL